MSQSSPRIVIEPVRGWQAINFREVWNYRELLFHLAYRQVQVRYKQSILGIFWAIIRPFLTMIVFSVFFGNFLKISPGGDYPYPIFSYAALLPWGYFSTALTTTSTSLVTNINLVKKIYFPRLIIPLSSMFPGLIDFAIAFIVLLGMMVYYQITPTINIIFLPLFILLAFTTALGVGLWLSAMYVQFRDIIHTVPFLVQIWLFITPVIYPSSIMSEPWSTLYALNPMVGVVDGFRWALLGASAPITSSTLISAVVSIVVLISGAFYFRRIEKIFADVS